MFFFFTYSKIGRKFFFLIFHFEITTQTIVNEIIPFFLKQSPHNEFIYLKKRNYFLTDPVELHFRRNAVFTI